MAENTSDVHIQISEECRLMRSVIGGILADDSFTLPTKGNKMCLDMAGKLARCFSGSLSGVVVEFSSWLVEKLNGVIVEAQKRGNPNELNKERLWRKFQNLTSSDDFTMKWSNFLSGIGFNDEPLFYQILTDEVFDQLLKKRLTVSQGDGDCTEDCAKLTFEEENAVRYVGGYVLRKLKLQPNCAKFKTLLNEMICEDNNKENSPSASWTNAVDRGGLVKITHEANQVFTSIECCLRWYMNVKKIPQMDETYKSYIVKMVMNDDDVQFHWSIAGFDTDEENEECLYSIINKWVTIRGFSFASSLMEMYKQDAKKGTGKSKSLRTKLYCDD